MSAGFWQRWGGAGLPGPVTATIYEIWNSGNMAFQKCATLNETAIRLISAHGAKWQKAS